MPTLSEIARVVRSKNAGPLWVTIDVLFAERAAFERAAGAAALSAAAVAGLYGVEGVERVVVPGALAIKFNLPRPVVAGSPGDVDVYGAQQHRRLLGVVL